MKLNIFVIFLLFAFSIPNFVFSQQDVVINKKEFFVVKQNFGYAWNNVKLANNFYNSKNEGNFILALEFYMEAYAYNQNNAELNYKIGVCYLNSISRAFALPYLEKSYLAKPTVASDILWQLAEAYHFNYKFDEAINFYNKYYENLIEVEKTNQKKIIEKKIAECNAGIELYSHPIKVDISNIKIVNSTFPDYSPVISADESTLIFTSRREGTTGDDADKKDGQYYEDIYVSYNQDDKWTPALNMGKPLNTKFHDATVGLSPDGQSMLIYRYGDIYICNLKGDSWTTPELLPTEINTEEVENSACFSYDGNTIYFTRGKTADPKTSNGDIYYSTKKNGVWGNAVKLSAVINSEYDEDGVFMHPDGRTLYFSSKGHNTMGGYDIFVSTLIEDNTWTEPKNLGSPINTPDDDIYFVLSADGKNGYYSSVREDALGFTDIYKIAFLKDRTLFQSSDNNLISGIKDSLSDLLVEEEVAIQTVKLTMVIGVVTDANSLEPIEATVEVVDNEKNETVSVSTSNSKTGKFLISLPSGKNYGLIVKADNYLFHTENFDIEPDETFKEITKDISLSQIDEGAKVILKNIFFDVNKSDLRSESFPELLLLKKFLDQNPEIKIEISGHTDNTGSYALNKDLSTNRSKAVVDYLIKQGITQNRLTYRGAAYDEPIASNNSEEGKQLNRRVEFKIVK